jgi:hypothetical protein
MDLQMVDSGGVRLVGVGVGNLVEISEGRAVSKPG